MIKGREVMTICLQMVEQWKNGMDVLSSLMFFVKAGCIGCISNWYHFNHIFKIVVEKSF